MSIQQTDYDRSAYVTFVNSSPLISSRIGLVASCRERRASSDSYGIRNWIARGGNRWGVYPAPESVFGGGSSNWQWSYASAIGEAVERISLSHYSFADLKVLPFRDVDEPFCQQDELNFYLDEQFLDSRFPLQKPDFSQPIAWVKGWSLVKERQAYIPASLVYLPYQQFEKEPIFTYPISIGTSCARSKEVAATLAILELIERDAWSMVWEARANVPEIHPDDIKEMPAALEASSIGLQLRAYSLTNDTGVPSVLAVVLNDNSLPSLAVGTAARLNIYDALERAVSEAITSWRSSAYLCNNIEINSPEISLKNDKHVDFSLQSLFYSRRENRVHFDFLLKNCSNYIRMSSIKIIDGHRSGLKTIKEMFSASGHDVCLLELTQCDASEVGLSVVRAVSTSLIRQPLGLLRPLAHPRLSKVPRDMGWVKKDMSPNALLQNEHPFP